MEFLEISDKTKRIIKAKLSSLDLSMREASLKAGLNEGAISDILQGRSHNAKFITILKIAEVLKCSPQELTGSSGGEVKVVGLITGNDELVELEETDRISIKLSATVDPDKYEARVIKGEWNRPAMKDGWSVVYRNEHRLITKECLDSLCVGKIKNGKEFLREVRLGSQPNKYHLTANNGDLIFDAEIEWCEPVEFIIPKKAS